MLNAPRKIRGSTAAVLCSSALAVLTFLPTVRYDFTNWDDPEYVVENPVVVSGKISRLLDPATTTADSWTPLTVATYALESRLFGFEPAIYHGTNVLLHGTCTALVALLLLGSGLAPLGAFVGAALFGIHPLQVESVAWVSARKNLLAGLFLLSCLLVFRRAGTRGVLLGTTFGALALLAKATSVVLVPLAFLDRLRVRASVRWRDVLLQIPLGLLAVGAGLLAVHHQSAARMEIAQEPWIIRALTMGEVTLAYARRLLLPTDLSAHYPVVPATLTDGGAILSVAVVGLAFGAALWTLRRSRAALFLLLWIPVSAFPHLNLIAGPFWMADRYAYLPLVGVGGLVGLGTVGVVARLGAMGRGLAGIGVAAAVVGLTLVSADRAAVWRSSIPLWEDTVTKAPGVFHGLLNLGTAYADEGRHEDAARAYRRSLKIRPDDPGATTSLANQLDELGKRSEAIALYRRALIADPDHWDAHYNLGLALQKEGRLREAVRHYRRAVAIDPGRWLAWNNLGNAYSDLGEVDAAIGVYREALEANPRYAPALANLGGMLRRLDRLVEAEEAYRRAVELEPDSVDAQYGLAMVFAARGELRAARERLLRVLQLDPELEVARRSLERVEERLSSVGR